MYGELLKTEYGSSAVYVVAMHTVSLRELLEVIRNADEDADCCQRSRLRAVRRTIRVSGLNFFKFMTHDIEL